MSLGTNLHVRLSEAEQADLKKSATKLGLSVSDFVRLRVFGDLAVETVEKQLRLLDQVEGLLVGVGLQARRLLAVREEALARQEMFEAVGAELDSMRVLWADVKKKWKFSVSEEALVAVEVSLLEVAEQVRRVLDSPGEALAEQEMLEAIRLSVREFDLLNVELAVVLKKLKQVKR